MLNCFKSSDEKNTSKPNLPQQHPIANSSKTSVDKMLNP
jgi:hypothetical protein